MKELFAILFKDTEEILTPKTFKDYWDRYGNNGLYGWRPPKKIYYNLHTAKSGFAHIPEELKPKLKICRFLKSEDIVDGATLSEQQKKNRIKREDAEHKRSLKINKENLLRQLKETENKLKSLG